VFTITQLSHHLLDNPTWEGAWQTLLLLAAVWFAWIYTTWTTNYLDPERLTALGFVAAKREGMAYLVPPLCVVPAGEFLMGSDRRQDSQAFDGELPQHRVTLPTFQIARFLVTVAEYACFVRAGHRQPGDWQRQLGKLDHPVVSVSWHDATAYTAWLAVRTGQPWRLPSEAEWEKAARGSDGRIYPWGNACDQTGCNTTEGGKHATTPVGSYPSGASPCGAQDMAGNIWEWTSSVFKPYPYSASDRREDANSTEHRVLRGGSWNSDAGGVRTALRGGVQPGDLNARIGFRVLCAVPNA
jgi:formylglycine-generating enzyme required for sulfatase activity